MIKSQLLTDRGVLIERCSFFWDGLLAEDRLLREGALLRDRSSFSKNWLLIWSRLFRVRSSFSSNWLLIRNRLLTAGLPWRDKTSPSDDTLVKMIGVGI